MPIYTIAYGTADGYIEIGGRREPVPVDRVELPRVSKISGGEAYTANRRGAQRGLHKDIGNSVGKEKVDKEVTSRYAGFGLALAILAAIGMISLESLALIHWQLIQSSENPIDARVQSSRAALADQPCLVGVDHGLDAVT